MKTTATYETYSKVKPTPKTIPSRMWWVSDAIVTHLDSGSWRVVAYSVQAEGVLTAPIREVVYAPATCETEHNAICWASHSKAWERIRLHSQGSKLLQGVKAKYPDKSCRKELFEEFRKRLDAEFFTGWLYKNQDAQDIVARLVLGQSSSRRIADNFLSLKDLRK